MDIKEHILTCLSEEILEVALELSKNIHKALRFGLNEVNCLNPSGPTNRERIVNELNDFMGVVQLAVEEGIIPRNWQDDQKQLDKKIKVKRFMAYAQEIGTINPVEKGEF